MTQIHSYGDSHSRWTFLGCDRVVPHWAGPWTMHRFGRGLDKISELGVPDGADVLLSFGEIDVRCHIANHAGEYPDAELGVMAALVEGYERAIHLSNETCKWARLGILSIVPAARKEATENSELLPFLGTDAERAANTVALNRLLREMCRRNGWIYVDVHSAYAGPDGCLPPERSDGNVHIQDNAQAIKVLLSAFDG